MESNPYLIQRLKKPYKVEGSLSNLGNIFSFGGGKINGGISKDAMKLLNEIWRYDYMGSAEFEWGAVPKSLDHIAKNISNYVIGETEVIGKYTDYSGQKRKTITKPAKVYFVCKKEDEQEVIDWLLKFADGVKHAYRTKEHIGLCETICKDKYTDDNGGWHDIDNHYLFFTDKEMFDKFCTLFEFKPKH